MDAPSAAAGSVLVWLSNLTGKYVGRANEICEPAAAPLVPLALLTPLAPLAIDELSLTFHNSGVSLAGAVLINCATPECQNGVPLGTVTECPVRPSPCDVNIWTAMAKGTAPACLTGDPTAAGSLDILALEPWDESGIYNVTAYFAASGDRSNTVSTTVERPTTASKDSSAPSVQ